MNEETIPDPPVHGALRWLWQATEWFNVQIYSSRSKTPEGIIAMGVWLRTYSEKEFGPDHPMCGDTGELYPISFPTSKPPAFLTIDDRAVCFEGDFSELEPTDLLGFKPWNKRPKVALEPYKA